MQIAHSGPQGWPLNLPADSLGHPPSVESSLWFSSWKSQLFWLSRERDCAERPCAGYSVFSCAVPQKAPGAPLGPGAQPKHAPRSGQQKCQPRSSRSLACLPHPADSGRLQPVLSCCRGRHRATTSLSSTACMLKLKTTRCTTGR